MNHRRCLPFNFLLAVAVGSGAPDFALAEIHGGIEIGAKGIRAIAVDVAAGDAEPKVLMIENQNTTLVAGLAAKKQFSPKAVADTVDIVARLAQKIRDDFKVPDRRLYIVGSSGLFAPIEGNAALIEANKKLLAQAIAKKTGVPMDFVSIGREAELTIVGVVPAKLRAESLLMDIGSGNTKGGGAKADGGLVTVGIPFGTVSFSDRVRKDVEKTTFAGSAARLREKLLMPRLKDALAGKAELTQRKRVYLAGGTVWAMTTFIKPLDRRTLVPLSARDIETFQKLLAANTEKLPNPDLSGAKDAAARKAALKDLDRVRRTFTRDQLVAGVEILKALSAGFHLDDRDKQLYFARNAYIGWILGYTMEKGAAR